jgi:hypothetical protein
MKKTIYNVAVLMDSQETCNRMRQLCIDNGLTYYNLVTFFIYNEFYFYDSKQRFEILYGAVEEEGKTLVTESEFIELLKREKA